MEDTVVIREATPEDYPAVATVMERHQYGLRKPEWIRWKYLQNPAGLGRLLLAERESGEVVGTLGLLPRILTDEAGVQTHVVEFVDLFVASEARGRRTANRLWQHAIELVPEPKLAFPNLASEHIALRSGWRRLGALETWIFPASWAREYAGPAGAIVNVLARGLGWSYASLFLRVTHSSLRVRTLADGEQFTNCITSTGYSRSPAFLNWRFVDNPRRRYLGMEFSEADGACAGHAVVSLDRALATVFDFAAPGCERTALRLLVDTCRERGVRRVRARGVGLRLWSFGFIRVPSDRCVVSHGLSATALTLRLKDCDW